MNTPMTIKCQVNFQRHAHGRCAIEPGNEKVLPVRAPGRIPRVARLMALAIRYEEQVRTGVVASYTVLADLGHVTRARISQIMNLTNLAPDIQEAILHLPRTEQGRDPIHLRMLQPIAGAMDWKRQRRLWNDLLHAHQGGRRRVDLKDHAMLYLASPYSHPDPAVREQRFRAACAATAALLRAGQVVFAPIVHSHPLVEYGLPTGWEFWERYDREHLARCEGVLVLTLDGWRESVGVQAEIRIATALVTPVRYVALRNILAGITLGTLAPSE